MEQQALSDFSVSKCILAEQQPATGNTSSSLAINNSSSSCSTGQLEKNVNNNNILPTTTVIDVKQEGDAILSGECLVIAVLLR